MERTLGKTKIDPSQDRNQAVLFTKEPVETFFELLYRSALELGLEADVDEKKYKVTLKTVKNKEEESKELSEEEQVMLIQDPQDVELYFKISQVEGHEEEEMLVAEAFKVKGTAISMRKVFMDLREKLGAILV